MSDSNLTSAEIHEICRKRLEITHVKNTAVECSGDKECQSEKLSFDVLHGCHPAYQSWLLEEWINYIINIERRSPDDDDMAVDVKANHQRRFPHLEMQYILITKESDKSRMSIARTTTKPAEAEETSGTERANITTLALVEYVTNAEACADGREVRWHVYLAVFDSLNHEIAVLPMSQEACACAQEISWARVCGKKTASVIYQMASSPYLSLLWLHTTLDYVADKLNNQTSGTEVRDLKKFNLASILEWDQCGYNGHFSYRLAMIDALLPKKPQNVMPRNLDKYADQRLERTQKMRFDVEPLRPSTARREEQHAPNNWHSLQNDTPQIETASQVPSPWDPPVLTSRSPVTPLSRSGR